MELPSRHYVIVCSSFGEKEGHKHGKIKQLFSKQRIKEEGL